MKFFLLLNLIILLFPTITLASSSTTDSKNNVERLLRRRVDDKKEQDKHEQEVARTTRKYKGVRNNNNSNNQEALRALKKKKKKKDKKGKKDKKEQRAATEEINHRHNNDDTNNPRNFDFQRSSTLDSMVASIIDVGGFDATEATDEEYQEAVQALVAFLCLSLPDLDAPECNAYRAVGRRYNITFPTTDGDVNSFVPIVSDSNNDNSTIGNDDVDDGYDAALRALVNFLCTSLSIDSPECNNIAADAADNNDDSENIAAPDNVVLPLETTTTPTNMPSTVEPTLMPSSEPSSAAPSTTPSTGAPSIIPITPLMSIILNNIVQGRTRFPVMDIYNNGTVSYQARAYVWLQQNTDMYLHTTEQILQRYALVCIYYATNELRTVWTDNNVGNNTELPGWLNNDGWLTDDNECNWWGITCNNEGFVQRIELYSNRLTGSLPPEIVLLRESLEHLDLYNNGIVHNSNEEENDFLGDLTQLRRLFYAWTSFEYNGGIPPSIGRLTNLEEYDCSYTSYSGALQGDVFANLSRLEYLYLGGNSYSSTIPSEITQLPELKYLYIESANVMGDLSFMDDGMDNIVELWVDRNDMSGSIPASIGNLSTLRSFSITGNAFSGTIPDEMANAPLERLWMYDNNLGGTVPTSLGALSVLQQLALQDNDLTGTMPDEICSNRDDQEDGLLTSLSVDCGEVVCSCCTCCGSSCSP